MFYMTRNGWQFEWSFKTSATSTHALGRIKINGLGDLTEVGSVLVKDFMEPSVFDLDDLNDDDSGGGGGGGDVDENQLSDDENDAHKASKPPSSMSVANTAGVAGSNEFCTTFNAAESSRLANDASSTTDDELTAVDSDTGVQQTSSVFQ